jgi:hypothetical protein
MLSKTAFAAVRACVWTAAFIKSLPATAQSQDAELVASFRAWRTLECFIMAWGPTLAPDHWEATLAVLHETLPVDQQLFPNKAPRTPPSRRAT